MSAPASVDAFIGLGSNLGDSASAIKAALCALDQIAATRVVQVSALYRSAPIDAAGPDFLNAVANLATRLDPISLLNALQAIELAYGRHRPYRNAPRTIDLDLLLYGDAQIQHPRLTVPHPRMHQRAFVLRPLAELVPTQTIPGQGLIADLLARCNGQRVERATGQAVAALPVTARPLTGAAP